jgi:hypothetical protein
MKDRCKVCGVVLTAKNSLRGYAGPSGDYRTMFCLRHEPPTRFERRYGLVK